MSRREAAVTILAAICFAVLLNVWAWTNGFEEFINNLN